MYFMDVMEIGGGWGGVISPRLQFVAEVVHRCNAEEENQPVDSVHASGYLSRPVLDWPSMPRRLLHCLVLIALIFQGAAVASASVFPQADMEQHCAGHAASGQDCACCADGLAMSGCAALCSAMVSLPGSLVRIPHEAAGQRFALFVHWSAGPPHVPLNPPPIS